ncbi:predicted protein [Histoplasma mississippiense (nom. inval.)]|uniref:predicted protein n=1 Tax=Ajellomyces capsulatus (strain NAm1 / WU24) TaxID=2059318 RepID=UPI000157BD49|nr:predicted protein [Histoplasma mississippiense (nom. inval.)]EDN05936.1 predicted protein [Histoplasma mississippiense (nom. inval.)]
MDRQGAEDPPPLPSRHLSSGAQQSTLPAYCEMLGDFLQKGRSKPHEPQITDLNFLTTTNPTTETISQILGLLHNLWLMMNWRIVAIDKYVLRVLYVVETYLPDNWLPENARLQLRKQEEKQRRRNKKMQQKKRLSTLRPRPSTRN